MSTTITMLFTSAVRQWTNVALAIFLIFFPDATFCAQRMLNLASFFVLFIPVYFIFIKPFSRPDELALEWLSLVLLMTVYCLIEMLPAFVSQIYPSTAAKIILYVVRVLTETFIFWLYLYVYKKSRAASEQIISDALLTKERQQYETLKLYVEGIQDRLHDLKYLLRSMEANRAGEVDVKELETLVRRIDSSYHTGNAILDIILTDANNKFAEGNIEFSCMVGQVPPDIMEDFELFSLLGNAFDNAAEYLSQCDREKRYVSFVSKTVNQNFLHFEIANYYEGEEKVFVGMPTAKKDKALHGYGIKNMKRITEKYGGDFYVGARDGEFFVSITIPLFRA